MKLYYNPMSTNCRRVLAVAFHLNAPLEKQVVEFDEKYDWASFMKVNPNGMIPALEDGSFKLWESNAIAQYLCDKAKDTSLLPNDPQGRADVTRWQCWQMEHFGYAAGRLQWENMLKPMFGMGAPDAAEVKDAEEDFRTFGAVLDQHLAGRDWVVGKGVTLADFAIGSVLTYATQAKLPWNDFKNMQKWYARLEALDAWKKSAPAMR